jgi:hypothetical protein
VADQLGEKTPLTPDAPAIGAVAINYTADQDLQILGRRVRGIYISVAGTLKVDFVDGTSTGVTLANLAAGVVYPFCITKIYQTGSSTAAGVVLY